MDNEEHYQVPHEDEGVPVDRCEKCRHYKMIDSAYGRCRRFPPSIRKVIRESIRRFSKWWYEDCYPVIPWTNLPCGEYDTKEMR